MFESTLIQQYVQALLHNSACGISKTISRVNGQFFEGFFDAENPTLNDHSSVSYKEQMWMGLNGIFFFP